MPSYPNQHLIEIQRETLEEEKGFLGINKDSLFEAFRNLSGNEAKLYCYFAANKDGWKEYISPQAIQNSIGMAKSTYYNQMKGLIEKGYIEFIEGNKFIFREIPNSSTNSKEDSGTVFKTKPKKKTPEKCAWEDDDFEF